MATAVGMTLGGCAAATGTTTPPQPSVAEARTVVVRIIDRSPLAVYFNLDDKRCTAQHMLKDQVTKGPEVTISDGSGNVLASHDGPLIGGTVTIGTGCTVDVIFVKVPVSAIYKINIKGQYGGAWDRTVEGAGGTEPQRVEVEV